MRWDKVEIQEYKDDLHREHVRSWLEGHALSERLLQDLPATGFVAFDDGVYYACGFLRKIEASKVALLDGLMANPKTFGKKRYRAIDEVATSLQKRAKEFGIQELLAHSVNSAIMKRSVKHGFQRLPHATLGLKLGE